MAIDTLYIPTGNVLVATANANAIGTYSRVGDAGGDLYAPVAIAASTVYTVGPFNEPRIYRFEYAGAVTYTNTMGGVYTETDDANLALKADIASPTFTGRVTIPNSQVVVTAYAVDGAIAKTAGVAKLSKAGVGAYTLAAPVTVTDDGLMLVLTSTTANAHVVTATGLIEDGVTGGAKNTATFAAFAGASITLMALGAKWHVVSLNAVTVA